MAPFGHSRRRTTSQPPSLPSASALAAATAATHSRPGTSGSLSSAAAATALKSAPSPTPVSEVVTKRMLRRNSSASSTNSARRLSTMGLPSLDRRDSYSSTHSKNRAGPSPTGSERMSERNLRANSPGPRPGSAGSRHKRGSSGIHDRADAPPVPPLPKTHAISTRGDARVATGSASPTMLRRVDSPIDTRRESGDRRMNFSLPTTLRATPEEQKPKKPSAIRNVMNQLPGMTRGRGRSPAGGWPPEDDREGGFLSRGSMRAKVDREAVDNAARYSRRLEENLAAQRAPKEEQLRIEEDERNEAVRRKEERRRSEREERERVASLEEERKQAGQLAAASISPPPEQKETEEERQARHRSRALLSLSRHEAAADTAASANKLPTSSTASASPSPPPLASLRKTSPPLPRAAGPSPIPPHAIEEHSSSSSRTASASPSRAHFASATLGEPGRKHTPPPRSRSPVKSALKHTTSPSLVAEQIPGSPLATPLDTNHSSSPHSDYLGTVDEPAQRKKKLSVSFSDNVNLLNTGELVPMDSSASSSGIMSPPPSAGFPTGAFHEEFDSDDDRAEDPEGRVSPSKRGNLLGSVGFTSIKHLKNEAQFSDDDDDSKRKGKGVIGISGKRRGSSDGEEALGTSADRSVGSAIMQHHAEKEAQAQKELEAQQAERARQAKSKAKEPPQHPNGGPLPPVVYSISPPPSSEESLMEEEDQEIDSPPPERTSLGRRILPEGKSTAFTVPDVDSAITPQEVYVAPPATSVDPGKERVQFVSPPASSKSDLPSPVLPDSMEAFDGKHQQSLPSMHIIPPTPPALSNFRDEQEKQLGNGSATKDATELYSLGHNPVYSPDGANVESDDELEPDDSYNSMPGFFPITPEMKPEKHRPAVKPVNGVPMIFINAPRPNDDDDESGDSVYSDAMEQWDLPDSASLPPPAPSTAAAGSSTTVEALPLPTIAEVVADTEPPQPAPVPQPVPKQTMKEKAQAAVAAARTPPASPPMAIPIVKATPPRSAAPAPVAQKTITKASPPRATIQKAPPAQAKPQQSRQPQLPPQPAVRQTPKSMPVSRPPPPLEDEADSDASESSFRRSSGRPSRAKNAAGGFAMRKTMRASTDDSRTPARQGEADRPSSSGGAPFPKTMRGNPAELVQRDQRRASSGSGVLSKGTMRTSLRGGESRFRSTSGKPFKSRFEDSDSDDDKPGLASRFKSRFADDSDDSDEGNPYAQKAAPRTTLRSSAKPASRPALHMIPSAGSDELALYNAPQAEADVTRRAGLAALRSRSGKSNDFPTMANLGTGGKTVTTISGGDSQAAATPVTPPKSRSFFSLRRKKDKNIGISPVSPSGSRIRKVDAGLDSAARRDTPLERSRSELMSLSHTRSNSSRSIGTKSLSSTDRPAPAARSGTWPLVPTSDDIDHAMKRKEALEGIEEEDDAVAPLPAKVNKIDDGQGATVSTVAASTILIGPDGMPVPQKRKKFRFLRKAFRLDD